MWLRFVMGSCFGPLRSFDPERILRVWSEIHMEEVTVSQQRYDANAAPDL